MFTFLEELVTSSFLGGGVYISASVVDLLLIVNNIISLLSHHSH
jgi:hypothetical protein